MVAAAYKQSQTWRGPNGTYTRYVTVSDVVGEYGVYQDGNGFYTVPADGPHYLVDISNSAAGTDTAVLQVYASGIATGDVIINSANVYSVLNRQVQNSPIGFKPGVVVRFKQA